MILIGSRALMLRNSNLLNRKPLDFDFIGNHKDIQNWMEDNKSKVNPIKIYDLPEHNKTIWEGETNIEFEYIVPGSSSELLNELVKADPETVETKFGLIPNLDLLFTIKSSHKFKKFQHDPRNFWKTAFDYHAMKRAGAIIRPEYKEFHKLREKESYQFKTPSLNRNAKEFFSADEVKYIYMHDDIHKAVALQEKPAYTYFAKDGEEVKSDKEKFFACSDEIKLNAVIEEAATLAIERSLSCYPGAMTEKQAYAFALAKVCSSITGGWFRSYAYENLFRAIDSYPKDYYLRFQEAFKNNQIRKFE